MRTWNAPRFTAGFASRSIVALDEHLLIVVVASVKLPSMLPCRGPLNV